MKGPEGSENKAPLHELINQTLRLGLGLGLCKFGTPIPTRISNPLPRRISHGTTLYVPTKREVRISSRQGMGEGDEPIYRSYYPGYSCKEEDEASDCGSLRLWKNI